MVETAYPLFDRPRPPVPTRDPSLPEDEAPRLTTQAHAIAERLRRGPATNLDLGMISQRFGARLHDLKRAGFLWRRRPIARGVHRYEMVRDFLSDA